MYLGHLVRLAGGARLAFLRPSLSTMAMSSNSVGAAQAPPPPSWEEQWAAGLEKGDKWDIGKPHPALMDLASTGQLPKGKALVPGCGRGYDVIALSRYGLHTLGLDLAPTAVEAARELVRASDDVAEEKVDFKSGDFFALDESSKFDLIIDYTFLCALEPEMREMWADKMTNLLAPGGELITLIFPIGDHAGGPPFAMSEDLVAGLLQPRGLAASHLERLPDHLCHSGREGKTALGRWRRA